jgi:hypothetical protein
LPLAVLRKRFLEPEWVFIFGIGRCIEADALVWVLRCEGPLAGPPIDESTAPQPRGPASGSRVTNPQTGGDPSPSAMGVPQGNRAYRKLTVLDADHGGRLLLPAPQPGLGPVFR